MDRWNGRWVVFDVGETLVDETRVWSTWADVVGIPRLTFMAVLGAVIARGGGHQEVFRELGLPHWEHYRDELEASYGPIRDDDLYPDVRPALTAISALGYRIAVFGNQPARRTADLRALDLPVEVIAMSDEMGVAKPAPEYFARVLELLEDPDASGCRPRRRSGGQRRPACRRRRARIGVDQARAVGQDPAPPRRVRPASGHRCARRAPRRAGTGLRDLAPLDDIGLDSASGRTGPVSPVEVETAQPVRSFSACGRGSARG